MIVSIPDLCTLTYFVGSTYHIVGNLMSRLNDKALNFGPYNININIVGVIVDFLKMIDLSILSDKHGNTLKIYLNIQWSVSYTNKMYFPTGYVSTY